MRKLKSFVTTKHHILQMHIVSSTESWPVKICVGQLVVGYRGHRLHRGKPADNKISRKKKRACTVIRGG